MLAGSGSRFVWKRIRLPPGIAPGPCPCVCRPPGAVVGVSPHATRPRLAVNRDTVLCFELNCGGACASGELGTRSESYRVHDVHASSVVPCCSWQVWARPRVAHTMATGAQGVGCKGHFTLMSQGCGVPDSAHVAPDVAPAPTWLSSDIDTLDSSVQPGAAGLLDKPGCGSTAAARHCRFKRAGHWTGQGAPSCKRCEGTSAVGSW